MSRLSASTLDAIAEAGLELPEVHRVVMAALAEDLWLVPT